MRQRINGLCEHGKDLCALCAKKELEETVMTVNAKMKVAAEDAWWKLARREIEIILRKKT